MNGVRFQLNVFFIQQIIFRHSVFKTLFFYYHSQVSFLFCLSALGWMKNRKRNFYGTSHFSISYLLVCLLDSEEGSFGILTANTDLSPLLLVEKHDILIFFLFKLQPGIGQSLFSSAACNLPECLSVILSLMSHRTSYPSYYPSTIYDNDDDVITFIVMSSPRWKSYKIRAFFRNFLAQQGSWCGWKVFAVISVFSFNNLNGLQIYSSSLFHN